jgi:hypothetical protein
MPGESWLSAFAPVTEFATLNMKLMVVPMTIGTGNIVVLIWRS